MPIQDGKYKAPNWSNSTPPPINASELNALSDTVEKADTNYTRDEILSDEVKQLIGLEGTATPNDAFSRITLGNKRYGINLYVKYQDGTPASSIIVTSSAKPPISGSMTTDSNGYLFLAQDSTSFTASIDNADGKLYIDLEENSSISTTLSETITTINLTINYKEEVITKESSITSNISNKAKSVDVCVVGGGGGGAIGYDSGRGSGGGGGGGYTTNSVGISDISGKQIIISIGSGGNATRKFGSNGDNGGKTTVTIGEVVITANGGNGGEPINGGVGNGNGGNARNTDAATNGNPSTTPIFGEPYGLGLAGGGGGGGGNYNIGSAKSGGAPYGAKGSFSDDDDGTSAGVATKGGGGGGGSHGLHHTESASDGGKGIVYLRFHH